MRLLRNRLALTGQHIGEPPEHLSLLYTLVAQAKTDNRSHEANPKLESQFVFGQSTATSQSRRNLVVEKWYSLMTDQHRYD
jgi:hypothetical protein